MNETVSLNDHFESRIKSVEENVGLRIKNVENLITAVQRESGLSLEASNKAVDKAERAQQLRNETQNEWRQTLSDLSATMMPKSEGDAAIISLKESHLADVERLTEIYRALEKRIISVEENKKGAASSWTLILAGLAALLGASGFILNVVAK